MPVEYFIRYKEKYYDVGTRLRLKYFGEIVEGVIEEFIGTTVYIRFVESELFPNGYSYSYSTIGTVNFDKLIVEIVEPVYYIEKQSQKDNRTYPPSWDVEIILIWYIIIMVVGTMFEARIIIWIFASAYFFLWKNGFLNGGRR